MSLDYQLQITIPFETAKQAEVACNTISPDPILKKNELTVDYSVEDSNLICDFKGVSDRVIRVAISNVLDNIKTTVECMEEFEDKQHELFTQ